MLSQHIEGRVLNLVERVLNGARIEDFRVECKGTWPSAAKAARQIAGHANAARGEPILCISGRAGRRPDVSAGPGGVGTSTRRASRPQPTGRTLVVLQLHDIGGPVEPE